MSMQEGTFVHKWGRSKATRQVGKVALYVIALLASWTAFVVEVYVFAVVSIIVFTGLSYESGIINQDASTEQFTDAIMNASALLTAGFVCLFLLMMLFMRAFIGREEHWYSRPFAPMFNASLRNLGRWVSGHDNPNMASVRSLDESDSPPPNL